MELIRQSYRDFGPTLATEALQERHGITVGRETVRKWMVEAGLWHSRKEVRWKCLALPFRVFNKEQRVTHTAVVENKRLGHALAIVKAQQDLKQQTKVLTNSEKTGYKKREKKAEATTLFRAQERACSEGLFIP